MKGARFCEGKLKEVNFRKQESTPLQLSQLHLHLLLHLCGEMQ